MSINVIPPPVPVEKKTRTITLTNRAPIQITEDEWPVIAQGMCGWDCPGDIDGWSIEMRVRQGKHNYIIHANYRYDNECREEDCQLVRVGRLISNYEATENLWKHMLEVGEELRSRIESEYCRKRVVYAVDNCFASLKPMKH